ncbi:ATPase [Legionella geestiana]|uniref:Iron-sulfur cluster carrier protein n=1 Tax=Legionella geestiana TaxID=45065 RepID=A0A0W0TWN1_9GAMM|nr:Mrp/NBP35 family ATP-binding protein [Legionella geestiana]KTD00131.1 ATPase [Legionella geestiana]QBS11823.1 ATP-binding protein [Legionella geestiana]QDQ40562.1 Mrp/NBP35 family ATP-binding protein [Legionella geestiana]STX53482.1 chromosome partitioning ATP-binding protein [Legionella geestiana]
MNIEARIIDILNTTVCPRFGLTVSDSGMQARLSEEGGQVILKLSAGFPAKPLEETLLPRLREAFARALPDVALSLELETRIRAHATQFPGKGLRGVKNVIAIGSGKGGVGKSTVTLNIACALAGAGARVGVLDADIYGPSIPMMLGSDTLPEASPIGGYVPVSAHGVQAMSIGYMTQPAEALLWRGPMLAKSLLQLLDLSRWDELDYLLIDLPPGTGDIALSLAQKIPLTGAVVVTTPQNVATLDAEKAIRLFEKTGVSVLGVVENMASHLCTNCNHIEAIFGEGGGARIASAHHIPELGQLPLDARIRAQSDSGQPVAATLSDPLAAPFLDAAMKLAVIVAKKPRNMGYGLPEVTVE